MGAALPLAKIVTTASDCCNHYSDIIMGSMAHQITSLTIIYSTVYSGTDQRKHQSSTSLAFAWGIDRWPHKWPVTRKMFPFDYFIMNTRPRAQRIPTFLLARLIEYRRKPYSNPIAWQVVLLAPSRWAMGYVGPADYDKLAYKSYHHLLNIYIY